MVSHGTARPLEHVITELIAAFTVCKMQVYTSFVMKGKGNKTFKTPMDVLDYVYLNSLQS